MTSIQEKIQKLLALSSSPNDNEAKTALALAQKLMLEHGISEDQLNPTKPQVIGESDNHPFKHKFQQVAAQAAAVLYGAQVINYKYNSTLTFVGRADNRKAAELTWSFFLLQIEQAYKDEMPKGMTQRERASYRREFKLSMAHTLYRRCADFQPPSSSTALVIHKDQLASEIADYFANQNIRTVKPKSRKITNTKAFLRGDMRGKAADIHRGVN